MDEFISKFIAWAHLNGITATPKLEKNRGQAIDGYTPPVQMVWTNNVGNTLTMGADATEMALEGWDGLKGNTIPLVLVTLQAFYGLEPVAKVTWQDFLNPPPPPEDPGDPMVGAQVPDDIAAVKDLGPIYYVKGNPQIGSTYTKPSTGERFLCVGWGFGSRFWKKR